MSSGATYSPGAWFALVSPSAAVLLDPELPSERLDELWDVVQAGEGTAERARALICDGGSRVVTAFALAMVQPTGVLLMVRGRVTVTVQAPDGRVRQVLAPADGGVLEQQVGPTDTLWFVRPGATADGVALPIVGAAVLADVLAWQPMPALAEAAAALPQFDRDEATGGAFDHAPTVPTVPAAAVVSPAAARAGPTRAEVRRLTPDAIRAAAGRTSAGLGSHPRRRYGAWDWSPPERTGSRGVVPLARDGAGEDAAPALDAESVARRDEIRAGQDPTPDVVDEPGESDASSRDTGARATQEHDQADVVMPDTEPAAVHDPEPATRKDGAQVYGILEFSDGRTVEITSPVIIGRAPSQVSDGTDRPAVMVALPGAGRGISRNHVRIDIGLNGLFVVDLGSRNGSTLQAAGQQPTRLDAWLPYALLPGMRLTFAEASCVLRER